MVYLVVVPGPGIPYPAVLPCPVYTACTRSGAVPGVPCGVYGPGGPGCCSEPPTAAGAGPSGGLGKKARGSPGSPGSPDYPALLYPARTTLPIETTLPYEPPQV